MRLAGKEREEKIRVGEELILGSEIYMSMEIFMNFTRTVSQMKTS